MNTLSMHEYYTENPQKTFTRTGSYNSYLAKGKTKKKRQMRKKSKKNKKGKRVSKKK